MTLSSWSGTGRGCRLAVDADGAGQGFELNRPGFARGWGSGHLAPLGDGVSIHEFAFNRGHVVD
jgi:hypothetical protein